MEGHLANWQGIKKDVLKGDFFSMIKQVIVQGGDEICCAHADIESNVYQCDLEIEEMIRELKRLADYEKLPFMKGEDF